MKQKIIKIGAVLMTLIVLMSTMSFTIHIKYCSDSFAAPTLLTELESCEIEKIESCCGISESFCCEEKHLVFDGQNEMQASSIVAVSLKKQISNVALISSILYKTRIYSQRVFQEIEYSPPKLVVNKQTIHQVFII